MRYLMDCTLGLYGIALVRGWKVGLNGILTALAYSVGLEETVYGIDVVLAVYTLAYHRCDTPKQDF